jgi:hypothetical protein
MARFALALLAVPLLAQSTPSPQPAASTTFYGVCALGYATTRPQPAGCFIVAHELSEKAALWTFSETDYSIAKGKVVSSVRPAGIYTPMRSFGAVTVGILGDAGVASNGTAAAGSYAGGTLATYRIKKSKWMVFAGFRYAYSAVAGTQRIVGIGIGRQE